MIETPQHHELSPEDLRWPPFLDPVSQTPFWCIHPLYQWQEDVISEFARPGSRVCVSTCNESGKTSTLLPICGLSAMVAFPGCYVFSTSGSEDQVREQLFIIQLEPIVKQLPGWHINTTKGNLNVTAPNGSKWKGYKCRSGGTTEGFHGQTGKCYDGVVRYKPCIYLVDECKSVPDDIFQAIIRIDPDFMLATSTPGEEVGWFYQAIDPDQLERRMTRMEHKIKYGDVSDEEIAVRIAEKVKRMEELEKMGV